MTKPSAFADLIRRTRAGDQDAATELVRRYEPHIRRALRMQLRDPRLRRAMDSWDICQSVLAKFFVCSAEGRFTIDTPEQLLNLLVAMARNKLATHARKAHVARRDPGNQLPGGPEVADLQDTNAGPSTEVTRRDLVEEIRKRLSDEERDLLEQRALGREWADIAADRGGSAEALRKKLARALNRVVKDLELDELE